MARAVLKAARKTVAVAEISSLADKWIAFAQVKPESIKTYRKGIKNLAKWFAANKIAKPSRESLIEYRQYLGQTYSVSTANLYLSTARQFFNFLYVEKLMEEDITIKVKSFKNSNLHKKSSLTVAMVKAVGKSFDNSTLKGARDLAIFALMSSCGLRSIEVVRANIKNLEVVEDTTLLYVQGKGCNCADKAVVVPANVFNLIQQYLKIRGDVSSNAPLFASCSRRNLGGRLTTTSISRLIKNALRQNGYDSARFSCHSLRHSAATNSLRAGASLLEVQQLLRHSSIAVTQIYLDELNLLKNRAAHLASAAYGW